MDRTNRRRVGLRDVAQRLGVSAVTISNAFNRPDQLSPGLRERVLKAAADMGYAGPDPSARMLRTGHAGAIALYNHDPITYLLEDPVAIGFMGGVAEICQERQTGLLVLPGAATARGGPTAIDTAAVDGFILYALAEDDPGLPRVLARRQPVVAVDVGPVAGAAGVGIDDRAAAAVAAEHLLQLGHRSLAVIAMEFHADGRSGLADRPRIETASFRVTRQRWQGYADACARFGIDPATVPVYETVGNAEHGAEAGARVLLDRGSERRPTAILAMSDRLALGALRAAGQLGLHVPEDFSIVGFDDIPQAREVGTGLTTIRQPSREKGRVAAKLLLDGRTAGGEMILLPTELVRRGSTRAV
jgi:DNA-binding LacI/PurR family transcriptional regulator